MCLGTRISFPRKRNLDKILVRRELIKCLELLPLAALINKSYFCVHGGIGKQLLKDGLKGLRKVWRSPVSLKEIASVTE